MSTFSILRDIKKARQSYVDAAVRAHIETLGPGVSDRDWDDAKRAAREAWETEFPQVAALLASKDGVEPTIRPATDGGDE